MRHLPFRLALVACTAAAVAAPFAARADTLAEAVAYAYEADPGLQAQRAALRAVDESYVQARSLLGLQASAGIVGTSNETEGNVGPFGTRGQADAETSSYSFSLSQTLYSGGRANARLSAAEAQIRAGRETLRRFEMDLLTRVVVAYTNVRRDEELLKISADAVKVLEKQLSDTEAKFKVRQVTATDLAQSRARLASARTQLTFARGQAAIARNQYLGIVGKYPADLAPEPELELLPKDIDEAFDIAERYNPQLLQAGFAEQVSRARMAEARAGRRPTIQGRFDARRGPTQLYAERPETESVTTSITITQPLFTGGQQSSLIRQAVEENNRDRMNLESIRRQVIQQVGEAWESLTTGREALVSLEDEVKADEVAFYGVREEERFALRTTLDILNAESELRNAQLQLVRARTNEYQRRIQLLAAIGALEPRLLAAGVRPYDPAANFRRVKDKGQLPYEPVLRAVDKLAGPPIRDPVPATLETARPEEASALPPSPPPAAEATPIVPSSELIERKKRPAGVVETPAAEVAAQPSGPKS
ncbi:MAG: TolC family outer membrane protein [Caulobacteraceae bacterium]|nr:TolC family outer membrane protein [Caulobacteraceae bacterium]